MYNNSPLDRTGTGTGTSHAARSGHAHKAHGSPRLIHDTRYIYNTRFDLRPLIPRYDGSKHVVLFLQRASGLFATKLGVAVGLLSKVDGRRLDWVIRPTVQSSRVRSEF